MRVKELMDSNFIYVLATEDISNVSIKMEKNRCFTAPVLDNDKKLVGWITSLDITRGLRENISTINEIMRPTEEVISINANQAARLAVLKTSEHKLLSIPVLNDDNQVVGLVKFSDIVDTLSQLYDIKVYKIFKAMEDEIKGITWDELMEASAIITRRRTGKKVTAEQYESNIQNATFGEAIWATGGLEKFFVGLIAIGELVLARKVGNARK